MSGELFNPEAFEQMPGQMSMEQVTHGCPRCAHPTLPPAVMPSNYRLCAKCGLQFPPEDAR